MIAERPDLPQTPAGFAPIPDGVRDTAFPSVRAALDPVRAVPLVKSSCSPRGDYAGASVVEALPGADLALDDFTATDLYAVTLLSVDPPIRV